LHERQQGRNGTMPRCCAGTECKHPELGLQSGDGGIKNCPDCGRKIHDPCSHLDRDAAKEVAVIDGGSKEDTPSTLKRSTPMPASKKKSNTLVRDQFLVVDGSFENGGVFQCRNCVAATFTWSKWNASKARAHLERCSSTPLETRTAVSDSSQAAKKKIKTLKSEPGCSSAETPFDVASKQLQSSEVLKNNVCSTAGAPPTYIQDALRQIHPTTLAKYKGCGLTLPSYDLTGCRILDLGCGAGRDVYLASQLVGAKGSVVGVEMTDEQLEVARKFQSYHAEKFGFANTEFYKGFEMSELEPASFDVIISNCVINLCTDKHVVLKACRDLLKPGGELYFSDVYASRRVSESLRKNEVLWGECLSGALYWNDFENLAKRVGFPDPRLVGDSPITIQNKAVANLVQEEGQAGLEFYSATYRLFAMDEALLEPACEDYGQAVIYKGSIPRASSCWKLDKGHVFEAGKVRTVCGNTYNMLAHNPRLKEHFEFIGDFSKHYGLFEGCGRGLPYDRPVQGGGGKGGETPASRC
jgi:arsenite methyltransferase